MQRATCFIVGVILVVAAGFAQAKSLTATPQPTPSPPPTPDPTAAAHGVFPQELVCACLDPGPGPRWGALEIGSSTLSNLVTIYQDQYEIRIESSDDTTHLALIVHFPDARVADFRYRLCVRDDVIYVIDGSPLPTDPQQIVVHTDMVPGPPPATIDDYVRDYGVPDAVTFAPDPAQRIAFWFEEGFALVVSVLHEEHPFIGFGVVKKRIYFPYQLPEGYETRWPFNCTQQAWIEPESPYYPSEPNPFNFDTMLATLTPQPHHPD